MDRDPKRLLSMASVAHELGRHHQSLQISADALADLASAEMAGSGVNRLRASALNTQGRALDAMGDAERADRAYSEALAICLDNDMPDISGVILQNRGAMAFSRGLTTLALNCQHQAIEVAESHGEAETLINAFAGLGVCYASSSKNYSRATAYYRRALELARLTGRTQHRAQVLRNMAESECDQGNLAEADRAVDEGLSCGVTGSVLTELKLTKARILTERGAVASTYAVGIEALGSSRASKDRRLEQRCLSLLGAISLQQNMPVRALEYFRQSLALATDLDAPYESMFVWNRLGSVYGILGDYKECTLCFQNQLRYAIRRRDAEWMADGFRGLTMGYVFSKRFFPALVVAPAWGAALAYSLARRFGIAMSNMMRGDSD